MIREPFPKIVRFGHFREMVDSSDGKLGFAVSHQKVMLCVCDPLVTVSMTISERHPVHIDDIAGTVCNNIVVSTDFSATSGEMRR